MYHYRVCVDVKNLENKDTGDKSSGGSMNNIPEGNHIYPTPPLGQDVTQGQFLSEV